MLENKLIFQALKKILTPKRNELLNRNKTVGNRF